jgi:uncharacterized protein YmfQ (DUF2313 family)
MSEVLIEQLQALLPPFSYDPKGKVLLAQLTAEGTVLGDALASLEAVENAIFPSSAGSYIADWERIYEISPPAGASQDDRIQAVLAAEGDLGGQSIPYFIRLASLFGVPVSIDTFKRSVVGPLSAGDPINFDDWLCTWRVNAPDIAFANTAMEARITDRRPANTEVIFGYGKETVEDLLGAIDGLFNFLHYVAPTRLSN